MKYIILLFISLFLSCTSTKKRSNSTTSNSVIKEELIVVLKDPNNVKDAKALIVNSGLQWGKLLFNEKDLKIALIKVPAKKHDFWQQRLQQSGVFSSVEVNHIAVIKEIENNHKNSLITIRKTACFGQCPVYEFIIFKDGSTLFNGLQHVNKIGKHKITLPPNKFIKLQFLLEKTNFSEYEETYNNPRVTDLPSVYITYQKKQIHIRVWENVPEDLKEVEKYIKQIVKNYKFIN